MGEEWGASTPFPYFASERDPDLDEAVREGRRREFEAFGWGPDDVPDPLADGTFASAVLRWDEVEDDEHASLLEWYRSLLALRRATSDLTDPRPARVEVTFDEGERWLVLRRGDVEVVAHLGDPGHAPRTISLPPARRQLLLASTDRAELSVSSVTLPGMSVTVVVRHV
jgi:maltooligosyltrehalose trehalohydrolase